MAQSTLLPQLTPNENRSRLADRWRGFVLVGALLLLLGIVGLFMVGTLTLVTVLWFGVLFLIGGATQLWHAVHAQGWRSMAIEAAAGLLYLIAGGLIVVNPALGTTTLTLALGAVILAVGLARVIIALQHRKEPAWLWLLLGGIVGIILGSLILAALPQGGFWILGLFVAIELIVEGWGMILLGLGLRRAKQQGSAA
ncbi:MAG: HdeD family acid-resistance protein [Pseudomonadota bacterium]